ncbi:hypothetical protein B0H13DRAFT_1897127 [Mycena leptocephala]|nr:hypothetical protein B0H13DRAFT_1897127 [Mycena leptocephala]
MQHVYNETARLFGGRASLPSLLQYAPPSRVARLATAACSTSCTVVKTISLVLAHPIHADLERTRPARVVNTGKDIGMWFGPSAAAEALRIVVEAFPACGLGVPALSNELLCHTL